ncbi:hypothetical protein FHW67_003246 [Herbaspirillum sp. Sphag1AN]|uniref:hypothetical protein n=1 Tax=unclassified Herbaspirillum TaxID=2624150 RepID=UPI00161F8908|nr:MULTISPECIES: hypothetical protein [unclassified Herbaspirillum]MBB3213940.1 hypothetical protein [Herbaspirillum sp. Sphag1AN]MBB3247137.1 hypothetical protein [Herbaspirillum sp. Sphag64]
MADHMDKMSKEQRRRKLLAEGALYRFGIIEAREQVRAGLTPTGLAKSAASRFSSALGTGVSSLFSGGGNAGKIVQSLTPLLVSGMSLLSKRYVRKSFLYYGIITAGVLLARYVARKAKNTDAPDDAAEGASSGEDE